MAKALMALVLLGLLLLVLLLLHEPRSSAPTTIRPAQTSSQPASPASTLHVQAPVEAWLRGPPTPLGALRHAATEYFPDMFDGSETALPAKFDCRAASASAPPRACNPCWGGAHCLPSFLILGVYQASLRT